jgi:oligopeptide/dipeptide ABC transporter ATP-binding protein
VSFYLDRGESLGIVGESGCGKSITALSIMQLIQRPGVIESGAIRYRKAEGREINILDLNPRGSEIRAIRGNEIAMIFQEPMTSLCPVYTVGEQISEAIELHQKLDKVEAKKRAIEMIDRVRISAPDKRYNEYPHQLSGGMRQRAMIAMALSCNPQLLIADEPTTALDVTIEAQILALIINMQKEFGMALMIITHNLGVIGEMADRVVVMYIGRVVETAPTGSVFEQPLHPYTIALFQSLPKIGSRDKLESITGAVPNPYVLPKGCVFSPRCPHAMQRCYQEYPPTHQPHPGHEVACWLFEKSEGSSE